MRCAQDSVIPAAMVVLVHLVVGAQADTLHLLPPVELCGNRSELHLSGEGYESSRIVCLEPSLEFSYCALSVTAPSSHVIHVQVSEDLARMKHLFHASPTASCPLDIFLEQHMAPLWHGDLCSAEPLPPVHLSQSKIILRWKSPVDRAQTKGRKVLATAVGHGEYCRRPGVHTCMKIDFNPVFCVADELTCDGREDCPPGSPTTDEGAFCDSGALWQRRVMQVINRMPHAANTIRKSGADNSTELPKVLHSIEKTINNFKRLSRLETTTPPASEARSFGTLHDLLAQYDPWGYLCLGVVLCGSLLLVCCGLWECCIRRYKTDSLGSNPSPTVVLATSGCGDLALHQPQQQQAPPNYDELDLPPSYGALFPNKPLDEQISRTDELTEVIPLDSITPTRSDRHPHPQQTDD